MNNHLNNLKRLNGGKGVTRYEYITSTDELYRNFIESKQDLNYALRKEVKRDRYVMNKEGLERQIKEDINETLMQEIDQLDSLVAADVTNKIYGMLGSGSVGANSSFAANIGKTLGKALAKGTFTLLDEITKYDND